MTGDLTPTESLMLEVLIARHRCGEHLWTFDKSLRHVADKLANRNLVGWKSGIAQNTIMVWLDPRADLSGYMLPDYEPPIVQKAVHAARLDVANRIDQFYDTEYAATRGEHPKPVTSDDIRYLDGIAAALGVARKTAGQQPT